MEGVRFTPYATKVAALGFMTIASAVAIGFLNTGELGDYAFIISGTGWACGSALILHAISTSGPSARNARAIEIIQKFSLMNDGYVKYALVGQKGQTEEQLAHQITHIDKGAYTLCRVNGTEFVPRGLKPGDLLSLPHVLEMRETKKRYQALLNILISLEKCRVQCQIYPRNWRSLPFMIVCFDLQPLYFDFSHFVQDKAPTPQRELQASLEVLSMAVKFLLPSKKELLKSYEGRDFFALFNALTVQDKDVTLREIPCGSYASLLQKMSALLKALTHRERSKSHDYT